MCATDTRGLRGARRQRGVSMIELMVGIVVAMLVGLAAAGSAVVFTAAQRQGIGVGSVAVNAGTVLAALKNDAATAGLGFFGESRFLCATLNLGVGNTAHWDGTGFAPVRITAMDGGDRVDILQSTRVEAGANVLLKLNSDGHSAALKSYLPVAVGDAVLLSPAGAGMPCLVRSVTAVAAATDDTPQTLTFGGGATHNEAAFSNSGTYTSSGGGVTLLGQLRWNRYRLNGSNLMLERPLDGASAVLARNVMAFRAQYGAAAAAAGSTTLETWEDAAGATFGALDDAGIARVRAVRIGMVTRSPQREKPDAAGNCSASTELPRLFGAEIVPDVEDWRCYRFRSAVVVVPMRNLVVGMKP